MTGDSTTKGDRAAAMAALLLLKADELREALTRRAASEEGDWLAAMPEEVVASMEADAALFKSVAELLTSVSAVDWCDMEATPDVKAGNDDFVLVAIRRASGKVVTYPALYLNQYPLEFDDEPFDREVTGFYEYDNQDDRLLYNELIQGGSGDAIIAWAPIPKFDGFGVAA